jgi:hypothetical protein
LVQPELVIGRVKIPTAIRRNAQVNYPATRRVFLPTFVISAPQTNEKIAETTP